MGGAETYLCSRRRLYCCCDDPCAAPCTKQLLLCIHRLTDQSFERLCRELLWPDILPPTAASITLHNLETCGPVLAPGCSSSRSAAAEQHPLWVPGALACPHCAMHGCPSLELLCTYRPRTGPAYTECHPIKPALFMAGLMIVCCVH